MIPITETNCNYHLTRLYKERDQISSGINRLISMDRDTKQLEKEYDQICDIISAVIAFRRTHPGCLLEGDPGYGPI